VPWLTAMAGVAALCACALRLLWLAWLSACVPARAALSSLLIARVRVVAHVCLVARVCCADGVPCGSCVVRLACVPCSRARSTPRHQVSLDRLAGFRTFWMCGSAMRTYSLVGSHVQPSCSLSIGPTSLVASVCKKLLGRSPTA